MLRALAVLPLFAAADALLAGKLLRADPIRAHARPRARALVALEDARATRAAPPEGAQSSTSPPDGGSASVEGRLRAALGSDGKLSLNEPRVRLEECVQEECPADADGEAGTVATLDEHAPQEGTLDARLFEINSAIINTMKGAIDVIYEGNDFARFYVLETVARVPYFAYLSVLHLRETLGERDEQMTARMRVHYAEADNELHHLLIMEALGGNASAVDRALAQLMAVSYYWYVVVVYSLSPQAAYHLSELIEDHAYHTYDAFLEARGDELKGMAVPEVARRYYEEDNPFLFDLLCTMSGCISEPAPNSVRRPRLTSLYDVFVNIRNDEKEHWGTLCNLVQHDSLDELSGEGVTSTQPFRAPMSTQPCGAKRPSDEGSAAP